MPDEITSATFTIRSLPAFEALFARLVRRAKRLGVTVPSFTIKGERCEMADIFEYSSDDYNAAPRHAGRANIIVHDIEVVGLEPVKLNGWTFAASIEATEKGNLLYSLPGVQVPARYTHTGDECEHCKASRRRKKLFIVRHDGGEFKQIGSTCIGDFLGAGSAASLAEKFAFSAEIYRELKDFCDGENFGGGGTGEKAYDLREILALTREVIKKCGWVSGTKARERGCDPTSAIVRHLLTLRPGQKGFIHPSEESFELNEPVIEHFRTLAVEDNTETYLRTANILAKAGYCSERGVGIACSLIASYDREVAARLRREEDAKSQWVGQPKERRDFTGTVLRVFSFEGSFGPQVKTILRDDDGNILVCTALIVKDAKDSQASAQAQAGTRVTFKATVKKHSEFREVKQTELLRADKVRVVA